MKTETKEVRVFSKYTNSHTLIDKYSGELTGVGLGVPALLRATGNEGHYLLLPEISHEFCTLLLPPTLWVDLEWDPAGSCVTCSPG